MTTKCHNRRDENSRHCSNDRHNDHGAAGGRATLPLGLIVGHCWLFGYQRGLMVASRSQLGFPAKSSDQIR